MKDKLATSWEIYNQIVWNPKLNTEAFWVGFADRMAKTGIREKPLLEWANESDIPWHRIRYFRCGEVIVWHREQRIDLFALKALPIEAWLPEENIAAVAPEVVLDFPVRPIYHFNGEAWEAYLGAVATQEINQLKVVSYNVLCDEHEKQFVRSIERYPAIARYLEASDADIIALQEATPALLQYLQTQPWVQAYFISEAPHQPTLQPFGQVILSKYPFDLVEHLYSPHKRFLVGTWNFNDTPIHLANVHLTSNRSERALQIRQEQLEAMVSYLNTLPGDVWLVGDMNMREEEDNPLLKTHLLEDVWKVQHPNKTGFTFDPTENPLAEKLSLSGKPGRLDRMYLRSSNLRWLPQDMALFGQESIDGDYLRASDHYGIWATFEFAGVQQSTLPVSKETLEKLQTAQPTYQSAIVLIPSQEVWEPIQQIRQKYDSKVDRWMPHITLIYGFIPEDLFEQALPLLENALQKLRPFEITLTDFGYFEHRKSTTAWLKPATQSPDALQQLQAALHELFPQCNEQSSRASGFTPHLSIGQFASPDEAKATLPQWHSIRFTAKRIALISRGKATPFEVKYEISLGTPSIKVNERLIDFINEEAPVLTPSQQQSRQQALKVLGQICSEVLNQPIDLQVFGSALLEVDQTDSDVDVLCPIPPQMPKEEFFENLQAALTDVAQSAHLVTNARVPTLKLRLQNVYFDVLAVQTPFFPQSLYQTQVTHFGQFEELSWQSLVGYLEGRQIIETATQKVSLELFQDLVRAIRLWANCKQLTGNAFGFFGNISWAIVAAKTCEQLTNEETPSLEKLLTQLFQYLNQQDWTKPLSLQPSSYVVRKHRDWMPIISSIPPYKNTTRNLARSTAQVIQQTIKQACQQLNKEKIDWQAFFAPIDVPMQYDHLLMMELESSDESNLAIALGNLEGSLLGVILGLEQQLEAKVRPSTLVQIQGNKATLTLGLAFNKNIARGSLEEFIGEFEYENGAKLRIYLEG
ncbi:hypothetical protein BKI52_37700 [marine bacterium AO1-C]|nr:hypothetical protein BKI52_37700 [marine bacterium AO1-C]